MITSKEINDLLFRLEVITIQTNHIVSTLQKENPYASFNNKTSNSYSQENPCPKEEKCPEKSENKVNRKAIEILEQQIIYLEDECSKKDETIKSLRNSVERYEERCNSYQKALDEKDKYLNTIWQECKKYRE